MFNHWQLLCKISLLVPTQRNLTVHHHTPQDLGECHLSPQTEPHSPPPLSFWSPHRSPLLSLNVFTFNPLSLQTSVFHSTLLKGLPRMSNSSVQPPLVWFFSWTVLQFCLWIAPLSSVLASSSLDYFFLNLLRAFSLYCKLGKYNKCTLEADYFTYCRTWPYLDPVAFNNILFYILKALNFYFVFRKDVSVNLGIGRNFTQS